MADATANRVGDENCMVFGFGIYSSRATKIAHQLQILSPVAASLSRNRFAGSATRTIAWVSLSESVKNQLHVELQDARLPVDLGGTLALPALHVQSVPKF